MHCSNRNGKLYLVWKMFGRKMIGDRIREFIREFYTIFFIVDTAKKVILRKYINKFPHTGYHQKMHRL